MEKTNLKQWFKNKIKHNAYIDYDLIVNFLKQSYIADLKIISDIFGENMTLDEWKILQKAIEEL